MTKRQTALLRAHHATPPGDLAVLGRANYMGKRGGGGYAKPWTPSYGYSGRASWDYWPGAWKQARDATPDRRSSFPAYDAKRAQLDIVPVQERRAEPGPERRPSFLQQVQTAVNLACKQDNKVLKLQHDHEARHALWNQYKQEIRQAFEQEYRRHQEHSARIVGELKEAEKQQQVAQDNLRAVILEGDAIRGPGGRTQPDARGMGYVDRRGLTWHGCGPSRHRRRRECGHPVCQTSNVGTGYTGACTLAPFRIWCTQDAPSQAAPRRGDVSTTGSVTSDSQHCDYICSNAGESGSWCRAVQDISQQDEYEAAGYGDRGAPCRWCPCRNGSSGSSADSRPRSGDPDGTRWRCPASGQEASTKSTRSSTETGSWRPYPARQTGQQTSSHGKNSRARRLVDRSSRSCSPVARVGSGLPYRRRRPGFCTHVRCAWTGLARSCQDGVSFSCTAGRKAAVRTCFDEDFDFLWGPETLGVRLGALLRLMFPPGNCLSPHHCWCDPVCLSVCRLESEAALYMVLCIGKGDSFYLGEAQHMLPWFLVTVRGTALFFPPFRPSLHWACAESAWIRPPDWALLGSSLSLCCFCLDASPPSTLLDCAQICVAGIDPLLQDTCSCHVGAPKRHIGGSGLSALRGMLPDVARMPSLAWPSGPCGSFRSATGFRGGLVSPCPLVGPFGLGLLNTLHARVAGMGPHAPVLLAGEGGAPKRLMGGSGLSALPCLAPQSISHPNGGDLVLLLLLQISCFVVPLARAAACMVFLCLGHLWVAKVPGRQSPLGHATRFPFLGVRAQLLLPLGLIGSPGPPRLRALPRGRRPAGGSVSWLAWLLWICCMGSMHGGTLHVWAAPHPALRLLHRLEQAALMLPDQLPATTKRNRDAGLHACLGSAIESVPALQQTTNGPSVRCAVLSAGFPLDSVQVPNNDKGRSSPSRH